MNKFGRIAIKTLLWIIGSIIGLVLLLFVLIRIPAVQNYVVQKVTAYLENKIKTPVRIAHVSLDLPKMLVLEGVYFEDQSRDTLLAGEKLRVDISMLKLLDNTVEIGRIDLQGVTAKINRTLPDSAFNFDYIINAFVTEQKEPAQPDSSAPMKFDIDRVNLNRIRFLYRDEVIGMAAEVNLNHLDTRIETFDLEGNMRFGIPRINVNGLQGSVRQWAVAQPEEAPNAADFGIADTAATSLLPELEFETFNLSAIDFAYVDEASAMDTRFRINKLLARLNKLDLNGEFVDIREIDLNGSDSRIFFGQTTKPSSAADTAAPAEPVNWRVHASSIRIASTNFAFEDANQPRIAQGFDYGNIGITDFEGELTDLRYSADTISGRVAGLKARDHSGFVLNRLQTNFFYTNQGAELDDLYAETPHTLFRNYIKISYPALETITEQLGSVRIVADISESHLGMEDVRYFVPDLDTMEVMEPLWPVTFHINTTIDGRLDDLQIPTLRLETLDKTRIVARAHIKGLPDMEQLDVDLDLQEFVTGKADLDRLIAPSLLPDSINLPADIRLAGTFNGGLNGFQTAMQLNTTMGNANVDADYRVNSGTRDTVYDAQLQISDIDIGQLMKMDSVLGKVSFAAHAKGTGLDPATAVADIQAELLSLEAMGYQYTNIGINATAKNGDITATMTSDDANIDFDLDAHADMRGQYPSVNVNLMVDSINLKNLGLMQDEFRYHGRLVADLETADIDHLNGTVDIVNSSIAYNDERYTLDTVRLRAIARDTSNMLQLRSEFLNAHMVGNFKLSELGASVQDILAVYYQPDSIAPTFEYTPQRFDFSAQFTRSRFIQGLLPDLTEMEDVMLDGSFNSAEKLLLAKVTAPRVVYAGTTIDHVGVDINTYDSTLYYNALINRIGLGNIELINTLLSGTVVKNQLDFGLWIKDDADKERYHLGMALKVDAGNFLFNLQEDGLMLNYEQWKVNPENVILFGNDGIRAHQFILRNNGQEMAVQSQDSTLNAPINLTFNDFRIETFSKMLESELFNMGGGINGTATISRLETSPVFVSDITIDRFFFGNDTVGDINLKVNNERENVFAADISITGNGNDVKLTGDFINPPNEPSQLDFVLDVNPLSMHTLEAFSLGYLRNTAGAINGKLNITGTVDQPRINGALLFDKATLNVAMLNATFNIDDQSINFNNKGLRFNKFRLEDSVGNAAVINGTVNTTTYTDFAFALTVVADDFQVLNSTQEDNDMYYGRLFMSSNLRIQGDMNNPNVSGTLLVNEKTNVTFVLPNDDPGMVDRQGIVRFVNRGDTARANVFAKVDSLTHTELGGLNVSVNVVTDKDAVFTVVIDPGSQDALTIQGEAELNAGIDPSGDITLNGTYTVESGNYSFSFGPVKRLFQFRKGSTLTWTGDPMDARMDITAVYNLRAPTLELVQNQIGTESPNLYKQRVPFNVTLHISEQLFQPQLRFGIDLDEDNAMVSQDVASKVNTGLAQLQENESEMNKQVFSLIVLGRFMAANPFESLSGGGGAEAIARNTVSSFLSGQLNRLAGDLIQGVEFDFSLQSEEDYSTGTGQNRTDLNIGVSKMLFNDRMKVTVGSNFELEGNARPGEQTTNIAGDIAVDYQLTDDGRYMARAYRKNQYQITLQGQFVETGLGFIVNMDYNEFREIFNRRSRLADEFNTESRQFRRRWDVERMETDTAYRDSVRKVILDSLERNDPEFRERMQQRRMERQQEQQNQQTTENQQGGDQVPSVPETARKNTALRNERDEDLQQEERGSDEQ
ncbi:translocation/assembly module TamB domain-containing protein [Parapedobacter sp. ISTM3]|uniref:translocation/assembly module TamB domain-containing protein n=1 Tax=Parapedobacter sp. ISTM3 TaxID=2800130 RepID=UPI001905E8A4|nr:translocation/assembly module TamB domain-containing protein [Parapedobacter sp. ISTM3]MBK1441890.1 translocation/assembly module TamB domain-containing protein [Parapedobacter sp. ISTM3]